MPGFTVSRVDSCLTVLFGQFLGDCVERTPDVALVELQTELREVFGLQVSLQTVLRTLHRAGYTRKAVRPFHL